MASGRCRVEIFHGGGWHLAGEVNVADGGGGYRTPGAFEYDFDYLDGMGGALGARDHRAVSCRYPLSYEDHREEVWPAFLLDLLPSGAARAFWERELGLPNTPRSDWPLLVRGAANPPGNLRIAEAAAAMGAPSAGHPGFTREDVIDRAAGFIEYARAHGASIAGGSGAAGDSPKFLLREDVAGRWHADGALDDARTKRAWLVKLPRSSRAADRLVLEAEAPYYRVAKRLGARTGGPLAWERDCLFVPRFDRIVRERRVELTGLESLYSLAGVTEFGASTPLDELAAALARFATDPPRELRELLLRDVLNVALGNTDNHGRNSAVCKYADGRVELSPLYDFAPMILDPQGIARVARWRAEDGGFPRYGEVAASLGALGLDVAATKLWLRELAPMVSELPKAMREEGVPPSVLEACAERIRRTAEALAEVE